MITNSPLYTDTVLIDWWTLTSFDDLFRAYWYKRMSQHKLLRRGKALQYEGDWYELEGGVVFLGTSFQNGIEHHMLRISGYAAEELKGAVYSQLRQGYVKCTRVDIQITIEVTEKWSQWDLLTRLKGKGRTTGWVESHEGGKYETVYVGSRSSARFNRVYIKRADKPRLLRLETEYKGKRAQAVAHRLSEKNQPAEFLMHELQTTFADEGMDAIFLKYVSGVGGFSPKVVPDDSLEKKERWLLFKVLPTFTRHINDHKASGRVLAAFYDAAKRAIDDA